MDVLHPRCCGLDVHKSSISACILLREAGRVQKHQRSHFTCGKPHNSRLSAFTGDALRFFGNRNS